MSKFSHKVLPLFEAHELPMLRILTDRGTEYCGRVVQHDYQLYLAINDIDHTKTSYVAANEWHLRTLPQDDIK